MKEAGMFTIVKKDSSSRARTGIIETAHGAIHTPAYVMVATRGTVKTLAIPEVRETQTQAIICNTFHLWREKCDNIYAAGGIHSYFGWGHMPIMTDSGGFQVFSYGFGREHAIRKVGILPKQDHARHARKRAFHKEKNTVTITDAGVRFFDGTGKVFLSPQRSIAIQEKLGADIIYAFDECTSPFHEYEYTKAALARTHAWARQCLDAKTRADQALYGIIQGGVYKSLREESARYINALPFDGFGIGGSFGEIGMGDVLDWTLPLLDERKPRHLLGIGSIQDVLLGIERGVDTFDCVIPTREARHGSLWTRTGRYDVRNASARTNDPLEAGCACRACASVTRKILGEMFRAGDIRAGALATVHNMYFFNGLMADARNAISNGAFREFKVRVNAHLAR